MSSINSLIGTFATSSLVDTTYITNNLICIDTSNNRIGINTVDPAYHIDVCGGTIRTQHLIVGDISSTSISTTRLDCSNIFLDNLRISSGVRGQLYIDALGFLKITT